jgi:hypothetical protein
MEVKLTNMWPPSETKKKVTKGQRDATAAPSAHDLKNSYLACDELKKENSSKESSDVDDALWD